MLGCNGIHLKKLPSDFADINDNVSICNLTTVPSTTSSWSVIKCFDTNSSNSNKFFSSTTSIPLRNCAS
jgi:hypothetical protein